MAAGPPASPSVRAGTALEGGQFLALVGGRTVGGTPRHGPGHIPTSGRARMADPAAALVVQDGWVRGPNPVNASDRRTPAASARRRADVVVDAAVFRRGGPGT